MNYGKKRPKISVVLSIIVAPLILAFLISLGVKAHEARVIDNAILKYKRENRSHMTTIIDGRVYYVYEDGEVKEKR